MSLASLKAFFRPRSVAVIGASKIPDSLGTAVLRNLLQAEFDGPILPVNPKHDSVLGVRCHRSVEDLPLAPELAVLCTPPETLPHLVEALGRRGTQAAIIMSAARDAVGAAALRSALQKATRSHGLRILGPDSNGIQVPSARLNASWMVSRARAGNVALISQSGSLIAGMLPWAFFSTALADASNSLVANAHLISKVYFPRMIVPTATIVVAFVEPISSSVCR